MSLLIGLKNTATQAVATGGSVGLNTTYRKYCKKICGVSTFGFTSTSVTLQQPGVYHVTATLVGSGDAAGDVTVQLTEDTVPVTFSTQTITTPTTELRTFVLDYYILVDNSTVLNSSVVTTKTISIVNAGVDATFTNVIMNIEKVV